MGLADKAFRINFVKLFSAGRTSGKPAVFRHDLKAADGFVVTWGGRKNLADRDSGQLFLRNCGRSQVFERFFSVAVAGASIRA